MKPVAVVGAGFSGLTLAHHLRALGVPVEIYEREKLAGGLIQSRVSEYGLIETAANALLRTEDVDSLFRDLGLEYAEKQKTVRSRYVYWQRPSRWPIGAWTTTSLLIFLLKNKFGGREPKPGESVKEWAQREIGAEFEERLLAPALQGVYAGDTARLSANLVLGAWLSGQRKSGGSVAPKKGMGQMMEALSRSLPIDFNHEFKWPSDQPVVVCTSAWTASEILKEKDLETSEILKRCESLPLTSATLFFEKHKDDLLGFGCLFPRSQGFSSLGVLFNQCIFEGRSDVRSETWITRETDEEIQKRILSDRQRLTGRSDSPLSVHVTRWPRAIPYYTVEWEKDLQKLKPAAGIHLHGNYLGQLGLAQILKRSKELARELKGQYGY